MGHWGIVTYGDGVTYWVGKELCGEKFITLGWEPPFQKKKFKFWVEKSRLPKFLDGKATETWLVIGLCPSLGYSLEDIYAIYSIYLLYDPWVHSRYKLTSF